MFWKCLRNCCHLKKKYRLATRQASGKNSQGVFLLKWRARESPALWRKRSSMLGNKNRAGVGFKLDLEKKKKYAERRRLVISCFVTTVWREFGPKWLQTFARGVEATCVGSASRLQDGTIRCCLTSCRRRSLGHRGQGSPRVLSVASAAEQEQNEPMST